MRLNVGFRLGFLLLGCTLCLPWQIVGQTVEKPVLDRAWQIGEELKKIETATIEAKQKQAKDEAAAAVPLNAARQEEALMNRELASIRNLYRADRVALATVDGRPGPIRVLNSLRK